MKEMILASLKASLEIKEKSILAHVDTLLAAAERVERCLAGGGRLLLDRSGHQVRCSGAAVVLTASEWALLAALAAAPHQVLSREELLVRIKGSVHDSGMRAVDSHIKNLRRKLGGCGTGVVQTVVGFGYRFGLDADPAPTGGDPREGDGTLPRPRGAAQGRR